MSRHDAIILIEAPGKVYSCRNCCHALGLDSVVIASGGHLAGYPDSLLPLGLSLSTSGIMEPGRAFRENAVSFRKKISSALEGLSERGVIFIMSDSDTEGHVIALDMAALVLSLKDNLQDRIYRAYPKSITQRGIAEALSSAVSLKSMKGEDKITTRATEGRLRAGLDRWLGLALSRMSGRPNGRVKSSILAMISEWTAPAIGRKEVTRPETGEVFLQCRSSTPGRRAWVRIPVSGPVDKDIEALARHYEGRFIPGMVYELSPAGAAIAPRFQHTPPYNTADILVTMSRQFGVSPSKTMGALQSAYMGGRISYPRTDSRLLDETQSAGILRLTHIVAPGRASPDALQGVLYDERAASGGCSAHGGLMPITSSLPEMQDLSALMKRPITETDLLTREGLEDAVVSMIARRCVEACMVSEHVPGRWRPSAQSGGDTLPDLVVEKIQDLDWNIQCTPPPGWSRMATTAARTWPIESILVEGMAICDLGRPSTWVNHVDHAVKSGDIIQESPWDLPRLTPQAQEACRLLGNRTSSTKTARDILRGMEKPAPKESGQVNIAMLQRLEEIFKVIPEDLQAAMAEVMRNSRGGRDSSLGVSPLMQDTLPQRDYDISSSEKDGVDIGKTYDPDDMSSLPEPQIHS